MVLGAIARVLSRVVRVPVVRRAAVKVASRAKTIVSKARTSVTSFFKRQKPPTTGVVRQSTKISSASRVSRTPKPPIKSTFGGVVRKGILGAEIGLLGFGAARLLSKPKLASGVLSSESVRAIGGAGRLAQAGGLPVVGRLGKLAAVGAGLFGAEQILEKLGVRGGAGLIGRRPTTERQIAEKLGLIPRRSKQGLFNKRALKILTKAKKFEKQAIKILGKKGLVFKKRTTKAKTSLDKDEIMLARLLHAR